MLLLQLSQSNAFWYTMPFILLAAFRYRFFIHFSVSLGKTIQSSFFTTSNFLFLFIYLSTIFVQKKNAREDARLFIQILSAIASFSTSSVMILLRKKKKKIRWFLIILTFSCYSLKSFSCTADCIFECISIQNYTKFNRFLMATTFNFLSLTTRKMLLRWWKANKKSR